MSKKSSNFAALLIAPLMHHVRRREIKCKKYDIRKHFKVQKDMTNEVVKYEQVKDRIITLRGVPVLLDADVAQLYGVETKRVNEAVKNNPDKFPEGFLFKLDKHELAELRSKISTSSLQAADNKEIAGLQSNLLMAG